MKSFTSKGIDIFNWKKNMLKKGGYPSELEWLLDIYGGLDWQSIQYLIIDKNKDFKLKNSLRNIENIWIKYIEDQIPLQYLIGRSCWRNFELEVSPGVLIPRQETELLVELAFTKYQGNNLNRWVDLGTGSGAISIALAMKYPKAQGHAVDISEIAINQAKVNINALVPLANINLHLGDWWGPLKKWWGNIDLVLANPPYIPSFEIRGLSPLVKKNEPLIALDGGITGLKCCEEIIQGAKYAIRKGGWLMLEHHHDQSKQVISLFNENGFDDIRAANDMEGNNRFVIGKKN